MIMNISLLHVQVVHFFSSKLRPIFFQKIPSSSSPQETIHSKFHYAFDKDILLYTLTLYIHHMGSAWAPASEIVNYNLYFAI